MELSVYTGIRDLVRIGDSEALVAQHAAKWSVSRRSGGDEAMGEKLGFSRIYEITEIGANIYFRQGRVALIRLQDPFRGNVQGKELRLFAFSPPVGKTWEELLVREFGQPMIRASGGRFGSEALFYSWGDISYNRMGPNEIAIYRDLDIGTFRQRSFGRDIKLFQN